MAHPHCPNCDHPTPRWLGGPSQDASVDYYRCDVCGHVWNVPTHQPDADAATVSHGQAPQSVDVYRVVIQCPNTGKSTSAGHEFEHLEAFDLIGRVPEAVKCEHCHEWHIWRHADAWVERNPTRGPAGLPPGPGQGGPHDV